MAVLFCLVDFCCMTPKRLFPRLRGTLWAGEHPHLILWTPASASIWIPSIFSSGLFLFWLVATEESEQTYVSITPTLLYVYVALNIYFTLKSKVLLKLSALILQNPIPLFFYLIRHYMSTWERFPNILLFFLTLPHALFEYFWLFTLYCLATIKNSTYPTAFIFR